MVNYRFPVGRLRCAREIYASRASGALTKHNFKKGPCIPTQLHEGTPFGYSFHAKRKGVEVLDYRERRGGYDRGPREMHKCICADCGKECEVPFKPTEGRPVYCRECFAKRRPPRRYQKARPRLKRDGVQRPSKNFVFFIFIRYILGSYMIAYVYTHKVVCIKDVIFLKREKARRARSLLN